MLVLLSLNVFQYFFIFLYNFPFCPSFYTPYLLTSVSPTQPSLFPVSQYENQLQRECCLDGMRETPLSYSCERRSEYIIDGQACVDAFLHCCKAMEGLRAERQEEELLLARSKRRGQGLEGGPGSLLFYIAMIILVARKQ